MKRAKGAWSARKELMGHAIVDMTDGTYFREGHTVEELHSCILLIDHGVEVEWVDDLPVVRERREAQGVN